MYDDDEKDVKTAFEMECKISSINRGKCHDGKGERGEEPTPSRELGEVVVVVAVDGEKTTRMVGRQRPNRR